ncbi:MAG: hypothetical protein ACREIV_06990, partial [Planctomycetaceae bacterium]
MIRNVRRSALAAGVCAAVALAALFSPGCKRSVSIAPGNGGTNGPKHPSDASECENLLNSALDALRPERLGISSEADSAFSLLNQWRHECLKEPAALPDDGRALLERHLSQEQLERVVRDEFAERDARHVRNAKLFDAIAEHAAPPGATDLERVVAAFDYVVRNVMLDDETNSLAMTPYEILLFGRGTAEDRAWVFAGVLRQMGLDAVILRPADPGSSRDVSSRSVAEAEEPQQRTWLVGVLLDEEVYLFDPRLGWPIPSPEDSGETATVTQPATLAEARAEDAVLRRLDLEGRAYPLTAEELQTVRVELIGHAPFWSPRMRSLQRQLSGEWNVLVYDGLHDSDDGPGLFSRVVQQGEGLWTAEDVSVWDWPARQIAAFEQLEESQSQRLLVRREPLKALIPVYIDSKSMPLPADHPLLEKIDREQLQQQGVLMVAPQPHVRVVFQLQGDKVLVGEYQRQAVDAPKYTLLKTRTRQLLGEFDDATAEYLNIRLDAGFDLQLPDVPVPVRREL